MKRYKRIFENMHYFMNEAVIHTEKYLFQLEAKLLKVNKEVFKLKTSKEVCKYLTNYLSPYNIVFTIVEENKTSKYGIIRGRTLYNLNIIIFCTNNVIDYFKSIDAYNLFKETALLALSHELVHRGQYLQVKKHAHIGNEIKINDKNDLKYYRRKDELMAFANMIIEELRFNEYNDEDIIQGIKYDIFESEDSEFLNFYKVNFFNERQILNQLYKYMYEYLKGEVKIVLK